VGQRLFDRHGKAISLTVFGAIVVDTARKRERTLSNVRQRSDAVLNFYPIHKRAALTAKSEAARSSRRSESRKTT
jgi:hypothetical protein